MPVAEGRQAMALGWSSRIFRRAARRERYSLSMWAMWLIVVFWRPGYISRFQCSKESHTHCEEILCVELIGPFWFYGLPVQVCEGLNNAHRLGGV